MSAPSPAPVSSPLPLFCISPSLPRRRPTLLCVRVLDTSGSGRMLDGWAAAATTADRCGGRNVIMSRTERRGARRSPRAEPELVLLLLVLFFVFVCSPPSPPVLPPFLPLRLLTLHFLCSARTRTRTPARTTSPRSDAHNVYICMHTSHLGDETGPDGFQRLFRAMTRAGPGFPPPPVRCLTQSLPVLSIEYRVPRA